MAVVEVVAALFQKGNRFFVCQRPPQKARGLLWEFVGGKIEPGETPQQALARECMEELNAKIRVGALYADVLHPYPDLTVHLSLYRAEFDGCAPCLAEHNAMAWILPSEIGQYDFCPADAPLLEKICSDEAFQ